MKTYLAILLTVMFMMTGNAAGCEYSEEVQARYKGLNSAIRNLYNNPGNFHAISEYELQKAMAEKLIRRLEAMDTCKAGISLLSNLLRAGKGAEAESNYILDLMFK